MATDWSLERRATPCYIKAYTTTTELDPCDCLLTAKMCRMVRLLLLFLVVNALSTGIHSYKLKQLNMKMKNAFAAMIASVSLVSIAPTHSNAEEASNSFANQLKLVQSNQVALQKEEFEKSERDAINREIKWEEGRLIARGAAILQPTGTNLQQFPLGVKDVSALDPVFNSPDATLFILGVGREDLTPIAAKKMRLTEISFPLVFELESSDLVFPYTKDAWLASPSSKDSIAVTCILSPGDKLAVPNTLNLIGFGVSDPVNIGGSSQRGTARVFINGKIDTNLYTKEEVKLLGGIDDSLSGMKVLGGNNKASVNAKTMIKKSDLLKAADSR